MMNFSNGLFRLKESSRRISEVISAATVWSNLARIGRTNAMKATVFVPFIGTFLLFNENVISALRFEPAFIAAVSGADGDIRNGSYLTSFYYLYFGLCSLGIGSIIYGIFCPSDIKDNSSEYLFATNTDLEESPVIAKSYLNDVLNNYFAYHENSSISGEDWHPAYPSRLEDGYYNLIIEMFSSLNKQDPELQASEIGENSIYSGDVESDFNFFFGSGYPNIHNISRIVWSSPRMMWPFTVPFKDQASRFSKDIAYVRHIGLSYSKFSVRMFISVLYFIGFTLLIIPTFITFYRLAINIIF